MNHRVCSSLQRGLASLLCAGFASSPLFAEKIAPEAMFLSPLDVLAVVSPTMKVNGDGGADPWTMTWTPESVLQLNPDRLDLEIVGVRILPILLENPGPFDEEGEYSWDELAAINAANFSDYFAATPGTDVFAPECDYDADLSDGILTVRTSVPGPWIMVVDTVSRAVPRGPLEPIAYQFSQFIVDTLAVHGDPTAQPVSVHRIGKADPEGGLAGPGGANVHVVSEGDPDDSGDDGFLGSCKAVAQDKGLNPKTAKNIDELVERVTAAQAANNGEPVNLKIYAHGNGTTTGSLGIIQIGTISVWQGGTITPKKLGEKLKGKVKSIELRSCYVGSDEKFIKALADAAGCDVWGYSTTFTACKKWDANKGYFDEDAKSKKAKKGAFGCAGESCPADQNSDGTVDGGDLGFLLKFWGSAGCSDLNDDGTTDGADLALLLAGWGGCLD